MEFRRRWQRAIGVVAARGGSAATGWRPTASSAAGPGRRSTSPSGAESSGCCSIWSVDGRRTIFDTRVIVGKSYHRTPVFSDTMTHIVLIPYWNITHDIARKEILPKVRRDVGYLDERGIRVLSGRGDGARVLDPTTIDWSGLGRRNLPYRLRQDPGDGNAPGRMKFIFPNRFSVYLHDTPSPDLFGRTVRTFRHGCVRVETPLDLAATLLAGRRGWTRQRITEAIATGRRRVVRTARLRASPPMRRVMTSAMTSAILDSTGRRT